MSRRRTEGKGEDAVLIDFGLARKFVQDKTGKNTAMVFSGFAPIEQYDENAKRGVYSDVYSLAAELYFAVTAEVPMTSLDIVAGAVLVPPSQIQPNIDRRVEEAILYGMKLKVKERPKSVQQWIDLIN
jgi:serine/threonine protein kinase